LLASPEAVTSASAGGAATLTGAGISLAALLMKRRPRAAEVARGVAVCGAHTHEATEGVGAAAQQGTRQGRIGRADESCSTRAEGYHLARALVGADIGVHLVR
jgi:hypothetical protein